MKAQVQLRRWFALLLWGLLAPAAFFSLAAFAYDECSHTTTGVYDGSMESAVGYDAVAGPATGEKNNSTIGDRVRFTEFAESVAAKSGVPRITEKGITRIEQHLSRPELNALNEPGNAAMIQRLRAGNTSPQDINFYMHELKESAIMNRGIGARDAHLQTLQWQGIPYSPGYEALIYHPSVIQQFPSHFNRAAWSQP